MTADSNPPTPPPWRLVGGLSAAFLALSLPGLTRIGAMTVDEPWYSQVAHSVAQGRGFHNPVVGSGGGDVFFLYTTLLAAAFKVFGTSFAVGRLLSVACGVVAIAGVASLLAQLRVKTRDIALCCGAVAASNLTFVVFRQIRPEALGIALCTWGIAWFVATLRRPALTTSAGAASLLGLAALCHPHFAILAALVGCLLGVFAVRDARLRGPFAVLVAVLGVCFGGLVAFIVVPSDDTMTATLATSLGRTRMGADGGVGDAFARGASAWAALWALLDRLSVGGRRGLVVLVQLVVLGVGCAWAVRGRLGRGAVLPWLVVGLVAVGVVGLSAFGVRGFATVEWLVYATVGPLLLALQDDNRPRIARFSRVLVALVIANNLAGDAFVMTRDHTRADYGDVAERVAASVPRGSIVFAPMVLWFPLRDGPVFTEATRWQHLGLAGQALQTLQHKADFAVTIDDRGLRDLHKGAAGDLIGHDTPAQLFGRRVQAHASIHGNEVDRFAAAGYGTVTTYKLTKAGPRR